MCQNKNLPDDPAIHNDDILWRRINPDWITVDPQTHVHRITTQAFQNYPKTNNMSSHLSRLTTPELALQGHAGYSLAGFTVQLARVECRQIVALDPTPDDLSHTAIIGDKPESVRKRFRNNFSWVVQAPAAE